ncbi:HAD family hydrolase [Haloechinothrix halophila]|uniref:HAD family hydrolase n=1 Tax=Haloechinothrix halophila TaxID=1069073 RepID=UPI0004140E5D|nr:HAD-IA family hydrolase [Haloechinothrix halophila]
MTNTAAELLASKPNVLLDFDGPVCSVFGGVGADTVARQLRERLGLSEQHSADVRDPFEILWYAAAEGRREAIEAERELTKLEVEAVASATLTPGVAGLLTTLADRKQVVVIVSNNSVAAIHTYLDSRGLAPLVRGVSARIDPDPMLLKPSPHLLNHAIEHLNATHGECVVIGDSAADIQAARAAGTPVIGFSNKPGKRERLASHQPDSIIDDIAQLLNTVRDQ